jgi:hypothetical protein
LWSDFLARSASRSGPVPPNLHQDKYLQKSVKPRERVSQTNLDQYVAS